MAFTKRRLAMKTCFTFVLGFILLIGFACKGVTSFFTQSAPAEPTAVSAPAEPGTTIIVNAEGGEAQANANGTADANGTDTANGQSQNSATDQSNGATNGNGGTFQVCYANRDGDSDELASITAGSDEIAVIEAWGGSVVSKDHNFVVVPSGLTTTRTWQGGAVWRYPCNSMDYVLADLAGRGTIYVWDGASLVQK